MYFSVQHYTIYKKEYEQMYTGKGRSEPDNSLSGAVKL